MKPISFIHLTDTHVNAPGSSEVFAKFGMADKLRRVLRHIEAGERPAFIIITGDLVHEGQVEDYRYLRDILDEASRELSIPIHVVLGNHDHRVPFREGYLHEAGSEAAYYYNVTIEGLRLIGLNSQVAGQHHGTVDEEQLAWLQEQLLIPAPHGTIIALHHPMLTINGMPGEHILSNTEQVAGILQSGDVKAILAGHVHTNNVGIYRGMCSVAAAGTAFGGELAGDHYRIMDACSYNRITVDDSGVAVQTITLPATQEEMFRFPLTAMTSEA